MFPDFPPLSDALIILTHVPIVHRWPVRGGSPPGDAQVRRGRLQRSHAVQNECTVGEIVQGKTFAVLWCRFVFGGCVRVCVCVCSLSSVMGEKANTMMFVERTFADSIVNTLCAVKPFDPVHLMLTH